MSPITAIVFGVLAGYAANTFLKKRGGLFEKLYVRGPVAVLVFVAVIALLALGDSPSSSSADRMRAAIRELPMVGALLDNIPEARAEIDDLLQRFVAAKGPKEKEALLAEAREKIIRMRKKYYGPSVLSADATLVRAQWNKLSVVLSGLETRYPTTCRQLAFGEFVDLDPLDRNTRDLFTDYLRAQEAAFLSGIKSKAINPVASDEALTDLLIANLTEDEVGYIADPSTGTDSLVCQTAIKLRTAIDALPESQQILFMRRFLSEQ